MPLQDDLLVISVPIFIVSVVVEAGVLHWILKRPYPIVDAIGSIGTGIVQQVMLAFVSVAMAWTLYIFVYDRFAVTHLDRHAPWVWFVAFVGVDFCYYWWHHASHKINFIWTGHLLHHQSEEFNLSTALRQSWLATLTSNFFYLPMAVLGVAPLMFLRCLILNTIYQFWIHTELVPRMPRFEKFFNSPSLHRVHHAINPRYLDKNFAGVFTIWDRMFGTYEMEIEKPAYGVLKPLGSWNSVWANVEPWVHLGKLMGNATGWKSKAHVLFADPAEVPGRGKATPEELQALFDQVRNAKLEHTLTPRLAAYVALQFVAVLGLSSVYLSHTDRFAVGLQAVFIGWVMLSLFALGGICDRKRWAWGVEASRLILGVFGILALVVY